MNRDETRTLLIRVGQSIANKMHLDCTKTSREQGFLLGDLEKSDEVQDIVWEDKTVKVEFQHRFSYLCLSIRYKENDEFGEVEFGEDGKTGNYCLQEALLFKPTGFSVIRYLFSMISVQGGYALIKDCAIW